MFVRQIRNRTGYYPAVIGIDATLFSPCTDPIGVPECPYSDSLRRPGPPVTTDIYVPPIVKNPQQYDGAVYYPLGSLCPPLRVVWLPYQDRRKPPGKEGRPPSGGT